MVDTSKRYPMLPPDDVRYTVSILAERSDYNHRLMNVPAVWEHTRGSGVKVAILDTGLPKHVDLRPSGGCSADGIGSGSEDREGHGTHVGGIIAALAGNGIGVTGIAPDVEDYYIKVLDDDGSGSIESVADGIHKAVDKYGVDIINMSLGMPAGAPRFRELENACNYAVNKGVTIFAATGNDARALGQPAIYDSVIAVGAVDRNRRKARFSNRGIGIDFVAGGVDVYSTHLNNRYASLSGTSMACPALAAVGALILSKHLSSGERLTPLELKEHICRIAFDLGSAGYDNMYGHGMPIFGPRNVQNQADGLLQRILAWLRFW